MVGSVRDLQWVIGRGQLREFTVRIYTYTRFYYFCGYYLICGRLDCRTPRPDFFIATVCILDRYAFRFKLAVAFTLF